MILADFRLSRRARKTVAALARVVCPEDFDALGVEGAVIEEVELTLRSFPPLVRFALASAIWIFEWSALFYPASFMRPFSRLDPARGERHFRRWWSSGLLSIRQLAKTLKGMITMGYYEQAAVKACLEFHPDRWIADVARRRLEAFGEEIRRKEAEVIAPDPLVPASGLSKGTLARKKPHAAT
ncbi:MAG: hypothetical protein EXR72_07070 [Myxococcales bacterium]|nr:hypothetical protein [Myxococcales bacterium]